MAKLAWACEHTSKKHQAKGLCLPCYTRFNNRRYYKNNHEKCLADAKNYRKQNREKINENLRTYYAEHREEFAENKRQFRHNNPEVQAERDKKHYCRKRKKRLLRLAIRYKTDPLFRLLNRLRSRLWFALKGITKEAGARELVGCSMEQLRNHLESLFQPGMTWENAGVKGWHIDHIRPCSSYDFTDSLQQIECFHYTNLQPLWWRANLVKGATVISTLPDVTN